MNGFFAENGGLVSENCAPYQATTKGLSCANFASCPVLARVKNSYILKNPNEDSIKKEILRNGIVITDWSAPPNLN